MKHLFVFIFTLLITVTQTNAASSNVANTFAQSGTGKASYYGEYFHGRKTANGSIFNQNALTVAAAPHIKMNSRLLVTNLKTGKSVVVKVTDRGAFHKTKYGNRTLDLSKAAFSKIAPLSQGIIAIKYKVL